MPALPRRDLASTGLAVTPLCVGGGPLSNLPGLFGEVPVEQALQTIRQAFQSPVSWIDTAAAYGDGSVERMIGLVVGELGGVPEGYLVATKADRDLASGDFSGAQVRRSVHSSMARLGLQHLPLVYLHDFEHVSEEEGTAPGGALETLLALRDEGLVGAVGLAAGSVPLMRRYLEAAPVDVVLTHNRFTLLDRSAEPLIDQAVAAGAAVVNAAVFGGGILAKGLGGSAKYAYRPAPLPLLRAVEQMELACARHEVPLKAAALQFSTRDPRITSTVVGVSRPERIQELVELYATPLPAELWEELEALAPPAAGWLG